MIDWLQGIHPSAVVHPDARLAEGVSVGPFSVIGPQVEIGRGSWIGPHVTIDGQVRLGEDNRVFPGTTIGFAPQDLKYAGEPTRVEIGDRNVFREGCQVHRGTVGGGGLTRIGNDSFFMVLSHVAHDCRIGDHVIFANAGTLAGHVEVGDYATIGAYTGVHQFCRIGPHAFIGGYSVITRDALPYCLTVGNRALCYGINRVGLKRKGFAREAISALERATRKIFRPETRREHALAEVEEAFGDVAEVRQVVEFIRSSRRGVIPIRLGQSP
ncbi:MAG: acyl-ACP--UDP-N-acetylglucosamine O-acyltransferase [Acidobacteriota bacterium]|nr:acyl-ACP--UDP-N-acetylglucosamine O-acyltransferase [Acidobacteriota bacterium]